MMKKTIVRIFIIFILLIVGGASICSSAVNEKKMYGFDIVELSEEKKEDIWNNINLKTIPNINSLSELKIPVVTFDVSENENILLGLKGMDNDVFAIVKDGKILHIYESPSYGSFYVRWVNDNILLIFVRSDLLVELSQDGQLINMVEMDMYSDNNNTLLNQIEKRCQIDIGNTSYYLQNNMGFLNLFKTSYAQLIKSDENGNEKMLYDINSPQLAKSIFIFVLIIGFIVLVISCIALPYIKSIRKNK